MAIAYYAEEVKLPAIKKKAVGDWIRKVAALYGKRAGDISYIFCSDEKILEVNKQYLQHDYYTDIITFDYSEGTKISGDLFISLDTVKSNSDMFGTNYVEELHRIIMESGEKNRTNAYAKIRAGLNEGKLTIDEKQIITLTQKEDSI